jgi:hypothetical protein
MANNFEKENESQNPDILKQLKDYGLPNDLIDKLLKFGRIVDVLREGNIYHIYYDKDFEYQIRWKRTSHLIVAEEPLRKINPRTGQVEQKETRFGIYVPVYSPNLREGGQKLRSKKPSLSQLDESWES